MLENTWPGCDGVGMLTFLALRHVNCSAYCPDSQDFPTSRSFRNPTFDMWNLQFQRNLQRNPIPPCQRHDKGSHSRKCVMTTKCLQTTINSPCIKKGTAIYTPCTQSEFVDIINHVSPTNQRKWLTRLNFLKDWEIGRNIGNDCYLGQYFGCMICFAQLQVGSTVVSDVFRFSRSKRAVVSQVMLPRTLSIVTYMIAGVVIARACGSDDVITIMNTSAGMWAVVIVVAGEMVINCTNLYFSGLAIVAILDVCGCRAPRPIVTIICGIIGSAAGALGILKRFIFFLNLLAVAFPPVSGIMCCEYFFVKAFRANLDELFHLIFRIFYGSKHFSYPTQEPSKPGPEVSRGKDRKLSLFLGILPSLLSA